MREISIVIDELGNAQTLWTDAIPLAELGALTVTRASNIEWDDAAQSWGVHIPPNNPEAIYRHPSREQCLEWEHTHINQKLAA